jgi:hypothetical protein
MAPDRLCPAVGPLAAGLVSSCPGTADLEWRPARAVGAGERRIRAVVGPLLVLAHRPKDGGTSPSSLPAWPGVAGVTGVAGMTRAAGRPVSPSTGPMLAAPLPARPGRAAPDGSSGAAGGR